MNEYPRAARRTAWVVAVVLAGCASQPLPPDADRNALACALPSNCVASLGGDPAPLAFDGSPAQALAALQATLTGFPEAQVVHAGGLTLRAVFTTPAGFQDEVDFRVDPAGRRIDYRSRSLIGLFDFGKNRSRMREFAARFELQARR